MGEPLKYKEEAKLYKSVGEFLTELGHFRHTKDLLLGAHNIMKEVKVYNPKPTLIGKYIFTRFEN